MNDKINELEERITYYSQRYYEGNPEIPDETWDKLVERLRDLDPESKVLKAVGWGFKIDGNKKKTSSL